MFAGVAPTAILIAKIANPSKVYAIDINPFATKYATLNIKKNKVDDKVEVIHGDAKEVVTKLNIKADHVIMNLPHDSYKFFGDVLHFAKMIHYYEILEKNEVKPRLKWLTKMANQQGYKISIDDIRIVGTYSPNHDKVGIDMTVKQMTTRPVLPSNAKRR
jgi:tRNA (guanine37-N1)-methyltransferase